MGRQPCPEHFSWDMKSTSFLGGRKKNVDDDRFDKKIMIRIKCVF